jgi:hypothetical protein
MACASGPKSAVRAERPVMRVVVAKYDTRPITFVVAGAWEPMPSKKGEGNTVVLVGLDLKDAAIAVTYGAADPGSTIEMQVARWALLMSKATFFTVTDLSTPVILSEEEASFLAAGEDKGTPMAAKCRIKLVSGHGAAYWVAILSVSPLATRETAFKEVDRIASTLKVHPESPE